MNDLVRSGEALPEALEALLDLLDVYLQLLGLLRKITLTTRVTPMKWNIRAILWRVVRVVIC